MCSVALFRGTSKKGKSTFWIREKGVRASYREAPKMILLAREL